MLEMQDYSLSQLLDIIRLGEGSRVRTAAAMSVSLRYAPPDWADTVQSQIAVDLDDEAAAVMICVLDYLPPDMLPTRVSSLLSSTIAPIRRFHLYTIAYKRRISVEPSVLEADLDGQDWKLRLAAARYCIKSGVYLPSAMNVLEGLRQDLVDNAVSFEDPNVFTGAPELKTRASLNRTLSRLLFRAEALAKKEER